MYAADIELVVQIFKVLNIQRYDLGAQAIISLQLKLRNWNYCLGNIE
jgi:hypothetical protein